LAQHWGVAPQLKHDLGGTAIYESTAFERALRDVNTAATHMAVRRLMMEDAGRVAFGLAP
jgi:hypothetical protein